MVGEKDWDPSRLLSKREALPFLIEGCYDYRVCVQLGWSGWG